MNNNKTPLNYCNTNSEKKDLPINANNLNEQNYDSNRIAIQLQNSSQILKQIESSPITDVRREESEIKKLKDVSSQSISETQ